jgi:hypothetical protein
VRRLTKWGGNSDLHGHLGSWRNGVVRVWHESRVLAGAVGKFHAGTGESGLSDSVVLRLECENDQISNGSLDRVWAIDESSAATDSNLVQVSMRRWGP